MKLLMTTTPKNSRGEPIPLVLGDFVTVNFVGASEVCTLTLKIVEKKIDPEMTTLVLSETGRVEEHQRRQYFRLAASSMAEVPAGDGRPANAESLAGVSITINEASDKADKAPFKIKLIDISGGGMSCAVYDVMPHLNSLLNITISLPGLPPIKALGRISRMTRREFEGDMVFMAGISFLEITENDRESIINFLIEIQNSIKKNIDLRG